MNMIDQHIHSFLSMDSDEQIERYIENAKKRGDCTIVTTEHMDLSSCFTGADIIPDFKLQQETIKTLSQKYEIEIRMGVEVGYKISLNKRINEILKQYPFDLVLLSIHENDVADVSTPKFLETGTPSQLYDEYLDLCIKAVETQDDYDVFAHVDYLIRYIGDVEIQNYKDKLIHIFKCIIKQGKALEFNTRFIYDKKNTSYLEYIFQLYYDCGGVNVSLGSDAHYAENYKGGFEEGIEILKNIGFQSVCLYRKRIMEKYDI